MLNWIKGIFKAEESNLTKEALLLISLGIMAAKFFDNDDQAAADWFETPNKRFADRAPIELVLVGNAQVVVDLLRFLGQNDQDSISRRHLRDELLTMLFAGHQHKR